MRLRRIRLMFFHGNYTTIYILNSIQTRPGRLKANKETNLSSIKIYMPIPTVPITMDPTSIIVRVCAWSVDIFTSLEGSWIICTIHMETSIASCCKEHPGRSTGARPGNAGKCAAGDRCAHGGEEALHHGA